MFDGILQNAIEKKYVVVLVNKAPNNFVFVGKLHYIDLDCLIKELDIDNSFGNTTCIQTTLTKGEIQDNHILVLWSLWSGLWVGLWYLKPLNNISVILWWSVFIGGGNQGTRRIPPTCRKSLTNFIT